MEAEDSWWGRDALAVHLGDQVSEVKGPYHAEVPGILCEQHSLLPLIGRLLG